MLSAFPNAGNPTRPCRVSSKCAGSSNMFSNCDYLMDLLGRHTNLSCAGTYIMRSSAIDVCVSVSSSNLVANTSPSSISS
jgi:hypothetical protein